MIDCASLLFVCPAVLAELNQKDTHNLQTERIELYSRPAFLNLFRIVAHFKEPQIFMAYFHKDFDVIMTMSLG